MSEATRLCKIHYSLTRVYEIKNIYRHYFSFRRREKSRKVWIFFFFFRQRNPLDNIGVNERIDEILYRLLKELKCYRIFRTTRRGQVKKKTEKILLRSIWQFTRVRHSRSHTWTKNGSFAPQQTILSAVNSFSLRDNPRVRQRILPHSVHRCLGFFNISVFPV